MCTNQVNDKDNRLYSNIYKTLLLYIVSFLHMLCVYVVQHHASGKLSPESKTYFVLGSYIMMLTGYGPRLQAQLNNLCDIRHRVQPASNYVTFMFIAQVVHLILCILLLPLLSFKYGLGLLFFGLSTTCVFAPCQDLYDNMTARSRRPTTVLSCGDENGPLVVQVNDNNEMRNMAGPSAAAFSAGVVILDSSHLTTTDSVRSDNSSVPSNPAILNSSGSLRNPASLHSPGTLRNQASLNSSVTLRNPSSLNSSVTLRKSGSLHNSGTLRKSSGLKGPSPLRISSSPSALGLPDFRTYSTGDRNSAILVTVTAPDTLESLLSS